MRKRKTGYVRTFGAQFVIHHSRPAHERAPNSAVQWVATTRSRPISLFPTLHQDFPLQMPNLAGRLILAHPLPQSTSWPPCRGVPLACICHPTSLFFLLQLAAIFRNPLLTPSPPRLHSASPTRPVSRVPPSSEIALSASPSDITTHSEDTETGPDRALGSGRACHCPWARDPTLGVRSPFSL